MSSRNDLCWCGSGKKWKKCHWPETNPQGSFSERKELYYKKYRIRLKTPEQIDKIRKACKLTRHILEEVCKIAKAGVTTNELNDFVIKLHKEAHAIPAPLGYGHPPYTKAICTSIDEVVCHGIPNDIPLKEGDIMNIDVSTILNGYFGDCSNMVIIGKTTPLKTHLVKVCHEALKRSIAILKPGIPISEIGRVIEDYATEEECSVVDQFVGHGVGLEFHEAPQIPHHYNDCDILLTEGMIFTIEPMINAGKKEVAIDPIDKWTVRTKDKQPSAQWEETVLITKDGYEVLT